MKNIATAILLGCIALTNAQVIIGDAVGTVPLTPLSVPGVPNKTSVLLEFAAGQNKGMILPYVRNKTGITQVGTMILDSSTPADSRVKYYNGNTTPGSQGWVDLSGQGFNMTTVLGTQPASPTSEATAKSIIGATTSAADGVLVLESTTKAMVMPTVADVQSIINPSPGMMVYVNKAGAKRLAVYNGSKWSYWKTAPFVFNTVTTATGKVWMDRNLGATRVATSSTDAAAFGDLYQWGRGTDGHQIRTSAITTTLSSTDSPGNGNFITNTTAPTDWRSPQNNNLWQGVGGSNNPCPSGFRIPTRAEFDAEFAAFSSQNAAGAFASPLKLPTASVRNYFDGSISNTDFGVYWSSTISSVSSIYSGFDSIAIFDAAGPRTFGLSVRCIQN